MDADRLTKRAFVVSATLAGRTTRRSRHMPRAGQAAAAIESLALLCDLSAPASVDVKQAAVSLQSSYKYIQHISCDPSNSFAVLRVGKEAGFEQDLYLVVCYVAPRDSTSISMATRDIWTQLEVSVGTALSKGQVLVVGDLNARTGCGADYTVDSLVDDHYQLGPGPTCTVRKN